MVGLVLLLAGLAFDRPAALLVAGLSAYVGWHILNLALLQRWIAHGHRFRLPLSFGIWEAVFDGLQARQLSNRRRRRGLVSQLLGFRDAADRLPDALVLVGEDDAVLWFNAAARRLLGLRHPGDLGREITELIQHPGLQDILAGTRPNRPLETASPVNGAWILSIRMTGSLGPGRGRILVVRDITRFHKVERVRRDFVANVSHELRTPITVFRGYVSALQGNAETAKWDVPLDLMDQQARRMQDLVDDLLLLSRLEMTEPVRYAEAVSVAEMLAAILEQARVLSGEKQHILELDADPMVLLWGERNELHSAFSNLIFNAVRYTPPGTRIVVSWQGNPDHACMSVRDSGSGIAAAHLPRLTERFYRVDSGRARHDGGTGLGLAIVKHVLERHDAELRIASEPGEGSTFSCHFPGSSVDIHEKEVPAEEIV